MKRRKRTGAALAALAAITILGIAGTAGLASACYLPSYDPAASLSVAFEKKLEKVGSIGPVDASEDEASNAYFIPHRAAAPTDGYLIQASSGSFRARYLYSSTAGATLGDYVYGSTNALGTGAAAVSLSETEASSSPIARGLYLATEWSGSSGSILGILYGTAGALSVSRSVATVSNQPLYFSSLVATGYYQDSSENHFYSYLFSGYGDSARSAYELRGASYMVSNSASFPAISTSLLSLTYSGPALRPGAFFAYEGTSMNYYLSGRSAADGSLYTVKYESGLSAAPTILSGVTEQLTDLLQNGTLLARGSLTTSLYNPSGTKLATLRTGSLRFVHECYDSASATWYSYFTRSLYEPGMEGDGKLRVEVYRCPTAELESLGG